MDAPGLEPNEALEFLLSFMGRGDVEIWSTDPGARFHVGAHLGDPGSGRYEYRARSPEGARSGEIRNAAATLSNARFIRPSGAWNEERVREALLNVAMADSFGADAVVCTMAAQDLHTGRIRAVYTQNMLSVVEALALIGLVMRLKGEVVLPNGPGKCVLDRSTVIWDGVRLLLPAWLAWQGLANEPEEARAPRSAGAAFVRMEHVLRARDHCHEESQLKDRPWTDEVLYHFDMYLVSLVGAFDASARVASRRLDIPIANERIGWHKATWRKKLFCALGDGGATIFRELVAEGSNGERFLLMVTRLRNLIHSETLQGRKHVMPDVEVHGLYLPQATANEVLPWIGDLGGPEAWGVHTEDDGRTWIALPVWLEGATQQGFALLGRLMEETICVTTDEPRSSRPWRLEGNIRLPVFERAERWLLGIERLF